MEENLKSILNKGICSISPDLDSAQEEVFLQTLYDQISLFNPVYKLVAAQGEQLVTRHILDCLAPAEIIKSHLASGSSIADLGSGSGLPGLVLASALPELRFTLVERMDRRAGFLRNTLALTGKASSVKVEQKDLSEVQETFDAVVFRAFRQMKDIIDDLARITHEGSFVFAYKSSEDNIADEVRTATQAGCFETDVVPYNVPMLDAKRSLLILKRTHA